MNVSSYHFGFLFDLDGVLIDSESEYTRIWNTVESQFPTGVADFATKIKGCTLDNILSVYYPDTAIRNLVEQRLYELEEKMVYHWTPGAVDLLNQISVAGFGKALVTSSDSVKMRHLYKDLPEIAGMFDYIVIGEDVQKSKPNPEGYLLAASKLNLPPEKCVVFEDSLQGVKAGKAAGCYVVGIEGTLSRDIIVPYSDIVVSSLTQIDLDSICSALENR